MRKLSYTSMVLLLWLQYGGADLAQADWPAPVPATGHTTSVAPGDDGDLEMGVALPRPRFTDHGDGTAVTDKLTGLVWLDKANCIKSDNPGFDTDGTAGDGLVTLQHALDFVAGLNAGTYDCGDTSDGGNPQTDWRLPNLRELLSLIHYGYNDPALSNTLWLWRAPHNE